MSVSSQFGLTVVVMVTKNHQHTTPNSLGGGGPTCRHHNGKQAPPEGRGKLHVVFGPVRKCEEGKKKNNTQTLQLNIRLEDQHKTTQHLRFVVDTKNVSAGKSGLFCFVAPLFL